MKFSFNLLKDFIEKGLPSPKKVAELLTMHSFEVKELKKIDRDWLLDIEVLANRASDCFSHQGIAREIAAIANLKLKPESLKLRESEQESAKDFVAVEVQDRTSCVRYSARVVLDVKVGPAPKWIRERLMVCGLRPVNNVVDIVNYAMLETGQPLHAFDLDKLAKAKSPKSSFHQNAKEPLKKIIVRKAKTGERITTLDGARCGLNEEILIIADTEGPLAIAGIKGGKKAEIDDNTRRIVLESANFDPLVIRRASRKIGLKTDASWRFEHGLDPNLTESAINRAASMIGEIAGGRIASDWLDVYPKKVYPARIVLDLNYAGRLLGLQISTLKIEDIFKKLGFRVVKQTRNQITVEIPTIRRDMALPEDLIEEIGRFYGYENIPTVLPQVALIAPRSNETIFWRDMVQDILKEAGFVEVYNYSFVSVRDAKIFGYNIASCKVGMLEIDNPVSAEYRYLRPSLIINLVKNIQKNQSYLAFKGLWDKSGLQGFHKNKFFESGKIFLKTPAAVEKEMLAGVLFGKEENFYSAKGVVELLLNKMGISDVWYDSYKATPEQSSFSIWDPRKCAEIKVGNEEIGFVGEMSARIIEEYKIEGRVTAFDIDFEKLQRLASEEHEYRPISKFPAAIRDLAVLVPQDVLVDEVLNKINAAGGALIRDVDLFDIYEGEELPEGKKNLAFHIIYQAEDRTLSSGEIDDLHHKITRTLEEDPDWQVRI